MALAALAAAAPFAEAKPERESVMWQKIRETPASLEVIGTLKCPQSAEIADSNWSIGCECLNLGYGNFVRFADPVWVDMTTGRVCEIPASSFHAEEGGTRFVALSIHDAPVMVAERAVVPVVAGRAKFSITDFGARPENATDALAAAIDACAKRGGGCVTVPTGTWRTGPIHLQSNVELHLAENAVLSFSDCHEDYLPAVEVSWEGVECINFSPLVYAYGCTNIAITGKGTFAPRIEGWEPWFKREAPPQREAVRILYRWSIGRTPLGERHLWRLDAHSRPHLIHLNRCRGVRLEDFRIRESPFWCVHLYRSRDVVVRRLDISAMRQNNDGIDVEMSRDVLIEDCTFNQGDDAIVLKAGRNREAREKGEPTENVTVRNCRAEKALTLATVGSEVSAGVRHVRISDCTVKNVGKLVHLKTNERRGGEIADIVCERIRAEGASVAVVVIQADALYDEWKRIVPEDIAISDLHDITVRDITCGRAGALGIIKGDARRPFGRISAIGVRADNLIGSKWSVTNAPCVAIEPLRL